jgi:hypothetical protein
MGDLKQNVPAKVSVRLFDTTTKAPKTGVPHGSVTATVLKADGTTEAVSVAAGTWAEVSVAGFAGSGIYVLTLSANNLNTPGMVNIGVRAVGCDPVVRERNVVSVLGSDIAGTGFSAATDSLKQIRLNLGGGSLTQEEHDALMNGSVAAQAAAALALVIRKIKTNKSMVDPDTAICTVYDDDGQTPFISFQLQDATGHASATRVFRKIPI